MDSEILMVGRDLGALSHAFFQVDPGSLTLSTAWTTQPIDFLLRHPSRHPEGILIVLSGKENDEDIRAVCVTFRGSSIVFVGSAADTAPETAAAMAQYGEVLVDPAEDPVIILADVVALVFDRRSSHDHFGIPAQS